MDQQIEKNKPARASLIVGIIAIGSYLLSILAIPIGSSTNTSIGLIVILLSMILVLCGIGSSIAALILGIKGVIRAKKMQAEKRGTGAAVVGIVLGSLGIFAICFMPVTVLGLLGPVIGNVFSEINSTLTP